MENTEKNPPKEYQKGDVYEVPPEGSLGLLALGYQGLVAWREAQEKAKAAKAAEQKAENANAEAASPEEKLNPES